MRFERKFNIKKSQVENILFDLIKLNFSEPYPERKVTSIYYDTKSLDLLNLSEDGNNERRKIRVRFYNDYIDKAFIEFKNKLAESGWKNRLEISSDYQLTTLRSPQFTQGKIPIHINNKYFPLLGISYSRRYFLSECKNIRITLDLNQKYGKVLEIDDRLHLDINVLSHLNTLEVKYLARNEQKKDIIYTFLDYYGLTLTRHSKYCVGMNMLY